MLKVGSSLQWKTLVLKKSIFKFLSDIETHTVKSKTTGPFASSWSKIGVIGVHTVLNTTQIISKMQFY